MLWVVCLCLKCNPNLASTRPFNKVQKWIQTETHTPKTLLLAHSQRLRVFTNYNTKKSPKVVVEIALYFRGVEFQVLPKLYTDYLFRGLQSSITEFLTGKWRITTFAMTEKDYNQDKLVVNNILCLLLTQKSDFST